MKEAFVVDCHVRMALALFEDLSLSSKGLSMPLEGCLPQAPSEWLCFPSRWCWWTLTA